VVLKILRFFVPRNLYIFSSPCQSQPLLL
jgi:hypothetical protein